MGIRADAQAARSDQTFFGQQGMLDAHHADVHEILDVVLAGEGPGLLDQRRRLDVLVGGKMIHDHGDLGVVKHRGRAVFLEHIDGDGRGDVVAEHHIQLGVDQLTCLYLIQTRVCREDFLGHCHTHSYHS